jgi:hypothetical protein
MTITTSATAGSLRRPVLVVTITTFTLAALMGVVALLAGGSFGQTEAQVLLTTLLIGTSSVCVLCYLATGGTPYAAVGVIGGLLLVLPVTTGLSLIWGAHDDTWAKAFGVGCVLAATAAHVAMLLALAWDRAELRLPLWATIVVAGVLAAVLTPMILAGAEDAGGWRLVGVLAILDVLGTLVTIALAKFGRAAESRRAPALVVPPELEARLAARAAAVGRTPEALLVEAVEAHLERTTGATGS